MSLQELKEQAIQLSVSDRLALVSAIIDSLKESSSSTTEDKQEEASDRSNAIKRMRGFLKTNRPAPTDEEVASLLQEHRVEKYL